MADAYEMEANTDNYLLEDGTGYYILEQQGEIYIPPLKIEQLKPILAQ